MLLELLRKLIRKESAIHYIGGSDVLPPPLKGQQEQTALEALEQKTVRLQKRQLEARAHEKNKQKGRTGKAKNH